MGSFNASSVVEPLDYNFTKYGAGKGVIKEPTDEQLFEFTKASIVLARSIRKLAPDLEDDASEEEVLEAWEDVNSSAQVAETARREAEIFADLCSGKPSADDLMKLPRRLRAAFYRWINGEVVNPEDAADDGTA